MYLRKKKLIALKEPFKNLSFYVFFWIFLDKNNVIAKYNYLYFDINKQSTMFLYMKIYKPWDTKRSVDWLYFNL